MPTTDPVIMYPERFDEKRGKIYEGVRLITIPTFRNSKLNAIVYSFLATIVATAKAISEDTM